MNDEQIDGRAREGLWRVEWRYGVSQEVRRQKTRSRATIGLERHLGRRVATWSCLRLQLAFEWRYLGRGQKIGL